MKTPATRELARLLRPLCVTLGFAALRVPLAFAVICFLSLRAASAEEETRKMPQKPISPPSYSAYWLVPLDHADSYVPLLLVRGSIEGIAWPLPKTTPKGERASPEPPSQSEPAPSAGGRIARELLAIPALVVMTYQRDSLWNTDWAPFKPANGISGVDSAKGTLRLDGRKHRHERARLSDVVSLLRNPNGTIPISRLHGPIDGQEEFVAALLRELSQQ